MNMATVASVASVVKSDDHTDSEVEDPAQMFAAEFCPIEAKAVASEQRMVLPSLF